MKTHSIRYEVIGRAVVLGKVGEPRHALKLLYRGDGTPWWTCSASLDLPVAADFEAEPGDVVTITVSAAKPEQVLA